MHDTHPLPLHLTPARLSEFCRQVRQRCADPAQALQQLTAVQALLGLGIADRTHPAYVQASGDLATQLEELRAELLARHAGQLAEALRGHDADGVARSFAALSRSGFADAAGRAWMLLDAGLQGDCARWLSGWCADARSRAEAASPYPDAPDFRAAGIALETFLAMDELRKELARRD
jgi:hypothetical protein